MATLRPHILTTLAVCMTCILVLFPGNAQAKDQVPDDTVWTPPSATFFYGQPNANITCKFVGTPYGVYWMKGSSAVTADTLVSRTGEKVSGPKHVDGSLTITEDYSLVFNNIQAQDAGNYICRVSNHHGFLIVNNTEVRVLDPAQVSIFTEPSVTGWVDDSVSLQCTFIGTPERVLWNRVQADPKSKSVETVLRYTSGGYEVLGDRRYSWSDSYGLIIRDLQVLDEGNFTCMVSKEDGTEIQNTTVLTVHARAEEPYIQISECQSQPEKVTNGTAPKPCLYNVTEDKDMFRLQCSIVRTKPPVDIMWQEGSSNLTASPIVSQRSDGTFDVTSTITRKTNQSSFTFKCLASGIAVDGTSRQTVIVRVTKPARDSTSDGLSGVHIFLIFLLIVALIFLIMLIVVFYRVRKYIKLRIHSDDRESKDGTVDSQDNPVCGTRRWFEIVMSKDCALWVIGCKKQGQGRYATQTDEEQPLKTEEEIELENLRKKLESYIPGEAASMSSIDVPAIHIGVFGVMGAGKSSFINSLHFAFRNEYKNVAIEAGSETSGSRTKYRDTVQLTKHIHIVDNRGMKTFSLEQIDKDLIPQIRGKRGVNPEDKVKKGGKEIHCPVLVCNLSTPVDRNPALEFIGKFSEKVNDHFGRNAMVVITHEENLNDSTEADGTAKNVKERVKIRAEVPENYIWTFENYTEDCHDHDTKKSVDYLKFLCQCLDVGERNIHFKKEREAEQRANKGILSRLSTKKREREK